MSLLVREVNSLLLNQLEHLVVVLLTSVERREANDHLVCQDTEGPPIDREGVTALYKNLWCEVVRRTAERICLLIPLDDLRKTEVSEANIAVFVHENVFWFEITIDDILAVQMTQSHSNLDCVETRSLFREPRNLAQMGEKFTSTDESHDEEYFVVGLEDVIHSNEEGMVRLHQNILFQLR